MVEMDLSENMAYVYHAVAKKTSAFPELKLAIAAKKLKVHNASRILSVLTEENAAELVEFACTHSMNEIKYEVARRNPQATPADKVKVLSENQFQVTITISKQGYENLQRAESVLAQKQKPSSKSACIETALDVFLEKEDPVRKAERARARKKTPDSGQPETYGPLTAEEKHAAFAATGGRCTHVNANGERCNSDRWVDVHHIIHRRHGGSNHPSNLTVLCSFHHNLVHQMGHAGCVRAPQVRYG